jgi:tetratricopeptide (TPR) repeat protein
LKEGFIDSYVDLFYLVSRKTPDLKSKYQEEHKIENTEIRTLTYKYPYKDLVEIKKLLIKSEQNLRNGLINKDHKENRNENISSAIEIYSEIANLVFHPDLYASIYFVQKGILLSVRYDLSKEIIQTLILMGKRFDNTYNSSDYEISKKFKEDAQKLYEKLDVKDPQLEFSIYENLINIYNEISIKKENQGYYEEAIACLKNQSVNIAKLLEIIKENLRDEKKEKYYLEQQVVVNLKVANMNYKLKNYSETLDFLEHLERLIDPGVDPMNVNID